MKQIIAQVTIRNVWVETEHSIGSGVVIQTGIVLANFHMLEVESEVEVNGAPAEVLAVAPEMDLILLKTETAVVTPIVISTDYEIGEEVFYVGNTHGYLNFTSFGRINYQDEGFLYSDVVPIGGCSGGGVYNLQGELLAINEAQQEHLIAVAIKSTTIKAFLDKYKVLLK